MVLEANEEIRRHVRGEQQLAGTIRSQFGSSGFNVNRGTPLRFLHNELDEAERGRNYLVKRATLTVSNYLHQEYDRAAIISLEAELNAGSILYNEEANSSIYLSEAISRANATSSGANITADRLQSQATASYINAAGNFVSGIADVYGASQAGNNVTETV
jgi:hypothetical protein